MAEEGKTEAFAAKEKEQQHTTKSQLNNSSESLWERPSSTMVLIFLVNNRDGCCHFCYFYFWPGKCCSK